MLLFVLLSILTSVTAKAVFAHFMTGNAVAYTLNDWLADIHAAQDAHIDAFALNILTQDDVSLAFQAANQAGFKLFFSFDYVASPWSKSQVLSMINRYKDNGAYYHHGGPVVSTFEGPGSAGDWPDIKAQTGCFFIPDWSSRGAVDSPVVDGLFAWNAWPDGPHNMTTDLDQAYINALAPGKKPYMMAVSPWFFTNMPGFGKDWLWRGDSLWFERWHQIMQLQPEFVEILTWNDWGESSYIGPIVPKATGVMQNQAAFDYVKDMPHDAFRMFLPYLIDAYKGNGAIKEGLQYWYRPETGCAAGTTGNAPWQTPYPAQQMDVDAIFVSALLSSPADLQVAIGGDFFPVQWQSNPGTGIYHAAIPASTGDISVRLQRNGVTVATAKGGPKRTTTCAHATQNWNVWAGGAWL